MKIGELIELLAEYQDEHGEDCEVRLMTQENWPFENRIAGVTSGAEMNEASEDDPSEYFDDQDVADDAMVYIVEGGQICYGSKRAWETARSC
ncbi:hypothetical protein [Novipirellula artificiosorum]|uniref:Uncharacterized protein n=1 Tax=Novipirellula artificiosorum TaxID=2528016 RepID=A0A5C6DQW9_9BACT|nr:hypothetical protein [Novipirellula artificiosorum]TWU38574.1 hypothetical protein Poly41_30510 [Novipirellula artificiosorum]